MPELFTPPFKVIPTTYRGINFRSRLEARWALFMDIINIQWAYEPEGYLIHRTPYLPDFFLYAQKAFLEIKPAWPTNQEQKKCESLAMATGLKVFLQHGPLDVPGENNSDYSREGAIFFSRSDDGQPLCDDHYLWCECPRCGICELQFDGRSDRNSCPCPHGHKDYNEASPKLRSAYQLAASERFET